MVSWRLELPIITALQQIKERDGVPINEQVRRALKEWIEKRGLKL
jgi:hypothetical protein